MRLVEIMNAEQAPARFVRLPMTCCRGRRWQGWIVLDALQPSA